MFFSTDSDLNIMRSSLSDYYPSDITDWSVFHKEAGRKILNDLKIKWFRRVRSDRYAAGDIDDDTIPFDPDKLLSGWDYQSDSGETGIVSGDRVRVMDSHISGGAAKNIYRFISDTPESIVLQSENFADAERWLDITSSLNDYYRDLSGYYTLFLIYRFLANDQSEMTVFEEQRDYFLDEYRNELSRLLNEQGVLYDWDGDGELDEIEENDTAPQSVKLVVAW